MQLYGSLQSPRPTKPHPIVVCLVVYFAIHPGACLAPVVWLLKRYAKGQRQVQVIFHSV